MSMATNTRLHVAGEQEGSIETETAHRDWRWAVCGLTAALLLLVASFLPVWTMTLKAPQYPAGLNVTAYGTRMQGDLPEVNALNHYIGISAIEPADVLEFKLFPFAMGAFIVLVVAGALFLRNRRLRVALMVAVWAVPVAMLVDMQWWLYNYGHNINPTAPLKIPEFTPKVLGSTTVMNFSSETMVASGFWVMIAAGALITVGPWLIRFLWESWNNTGDERAK